MTLSDNEIIQLLDSESESKNHDFKRGFEWKRKTKATLEVVKDIIAMANTQDGGKLIIGVDDSTKEFAGEPDQWWITFDSTKVMDIVNNHCEPKINVTVNVKSQFKYNEKVGHVVILQITEFDTIPIICTKQGDTSDGENILKTSGFYIRTNRSSTEEISSSDDLRDLINRATLKNGEQILRSFDAIVRGKTIPQPENPLEQYRNELNEAKDMI